MRARREEEFQLLREIQRERPKILARNYDSIVNAAQNLGKYLAKREMSVSQIRNIFSEVRWIQGIWESGDKEKVATAVNRLKLLRPKLAYQARRIEGVKPLQEILDPMISEIGADKTKFKYFVDFFEAVVAYHKYYGG